MIKKEYITKRLEKLEYFFYVLFYRDKYKKKYEELDKPANKYTVTVLFPSKEIMEDAISKN